VDPEAADLLRSLRDDPRPDVQREPRPEDAARVREDLRQVQCLAGVAGRAGDPDPADGVAGVSTQGPTGSSCGAGADSNITPASSTAASASVPESLTAASIGWITAASMPSVFSVSS